MKDFAKNPLEYRLFCQNENPGKRFFQNIAEKNEPKKHVLCCRFFKKNRLNTGFFKKKPIGRISFFEDIEWWNRDIEWWNEDIKWWNRDISW